MLWSHYLTKFSLGWAGCRGAREGDSTWCHRCGASSVPGRIPVARPGSAVPGQTLHTTEQQKTCKPSPKPHSPASPTSNQQHLPAGPPWQAQSHAPGLGFGEVPEDFTDSLCYKPEASGCSCPPVRHPGDRRPGALQARSNPKCSGIIQQAPEQVVSAPTRSLSPHGDKALTLSIYNLLPSAVIYLFF